MRLGTRHECQELAEGIGSLLGWRKGFRQKKIETHRKIIGGRLTMIGAMELQLDDGPRLSLSIGSGFGRCSGISPTFTKIFAKGIKKLAGNMLGDLRKTCRKNVGGYRICGRFGLHPKKIGSGHRCTSRRRTREWT
ncbi:hypothetical protein B296_00056114 [Ensete ventricosum]|uniref:Uncharacterized protein n=1 Tax=Ensete ventricosum TaxID=4639 RepID=A0A426X266_ENSVE|nr:hypothetical protein B296_00056114 [Ensete ventricosum]